jgi:hypothetical protein
MESSTIKKNDDIIDKEVEQTRNDAKCSNVMTALKLTTGTRAANRVPRTTWKIHIFREQNTNASMCKRSRTYTIS